MGRILLSKKTSASFSAASGNVVIAASSNVGNALAGVIENPGRTALLSRLRHSDGSGEPSHTIYQRTSRTHSNRKSHAPTQQKRRQFKIIKKIVKTRPHVSKRDL